MHVYTRKQSILYAILYATLAVSVNGNVSLISESSFLSPFDSSVSRCVSRCFVVFSETLRNMNGRKTNAWDIY